MGHNIFTETHIIEESSTFVGLRVYYCILAALPGKRRGRLSQWGRALRSGWSKIAGQGWGVAF